MVRLFGGKLKEKKEFQIKVNFRTKLPSAEYDVIHGLWVKLLLQFKEELEEKVQTGAIRSETYDMLSKSFDFQKYLEQGVKSDEGLAAVFEAATRAKPSLPKSGPQKAVPSSPTPQISSTTPPITPESTPSPTFPPPTPMQHSSAASSELESSAKTPTFDIPPPPMPVRPTSELASSASPTSESLSSSPSLSATLKEFSFANSTTTSPARDVASPASEPSALPPPIPPPPPAPSRVPVRSSPSPSLPASPSGSVPKVSIRASPVSSDKRRVQSLQSEEERATGIAVLRQRMLAQLREKKGS